MSESSKNRENIVSFASLGMSYWRLQIVLIFPWIAEEKIANCYLLLENTEEKIANLVLIRNLFFRRNFFRINFFP